MLVGDAGSFVDPMTGEGITPGMESSLLAAPVLIDALESGDFGAGRLEAYERAFRAYFDPSMMFLDFCAEMLRNRYLSAPVAEGARARLPGRATGSAEFAQTCGSYFGGLDVRPFDILGKVWLRSMEDVMLAWPRFVSQLGGEERDAGHLPRGADATGTWRSPGLCSGIPDGTCAGCVTCSCSGHACWQPPMACRTTHAWRACS